MSELMKMTVEVAKPKEIGDVKDFITTAMKAAEDGLQVEDLMTVMQPAYEAIKGGKQIPAEAKAMFTYEGKAAFKWLLCSIIDGIWDKAFKPAEPA